MRKISKEEKLDYARRYRQARSQGVMTKDFCDENRLSSSMLSRYLKLAAQDGCVSSQANQPFVRVPVPVAGGRQPVGDGSAVAVELKGVSITLGPGYSARQLEQVLVLLGVAHAV